MYADLHRHLDGSLRRSTLDELAAPLGIRVPDDFGFEAGMGLSRALDCFRLTLSVLQTPNAVRRVAAEICEDAAREGVSTLEIRFAPQLHGGASVEAIVDAAIGGLDGRAGLILCGLYGEDPSVLDRLVDIATARDAVVGLDLAGGPSTGHAFDLADYARPFSRARDAGLGRTVHASEGRPPAEIRTAVERLHAQRIGHGTTLLDDPAVLELVLERGITIEACPTSNVHTGVIPSVVAHPIAKWIDAGVNVVVCTDNTLMSRVTAPVEHDNVRRVEGMTDARMEAIVRAGHEARFARVLPISLSTC